MVFLFVIYTRSIFVRIMADKRKTIGSNANKKALALDLYLNTDKSQKEICALVGVTEKTFTIWKKKEQWDDQKSALTLTPHKIIRNIYQKMEELSQGAGGLDADKLVKLASAIEKLSDRSTTISQIINTFKEFTTYLFEVDAELAKVVNTHMQQFINNKVSNNG